MTSLPRIYKKYIDLGLAKDMAYKTNFFIKMFALIIADIIGPLVTILIYQTTSGIPGWSFPEFILFQGTFILVFGLSHTFVFTFPFEVISMVRRGDFNKVLTAPMSPLLNVTFRSFDLEGIAEVVVGIALISWSLTQIHTTAAAGIIYGLLILAGLLFMYSVMILIAALSFLVVKSWAVIDLFFKTTDMARYPTSIYGNPLRFFVSFLFPIAIAATYPATILLKGVSWQAVLAILAPVIAFFLLALMLWEKGMRRYTSAGG